MRADADLETMFPVVVFAEWHYDGMLCGAETTDTGAMWECPLLLELQNLTEEARPRGLGPRHETNMRAREESYRCVDPAEGSDAMFRTTSSHDSWSQSFTYNWDPLCLSFLQFLRKFTYLGYRTLNRAGQSVGRTASVTMIAQTKSWTICSVGTRQPTLRQTNMLSC